MCEYSDLNSEKMTHLWKSILLHIKATHIMNFDQKGVKCWIHESYLFFVVTEMPQNHSGHRIRVFWSWISEKSTSTVRTSSSIQGLVTFWYSMTGHWSSMTHWQCHWTSVRAFIVFSTPCSGWTSIPSLIYWISHSVTK